MSKISKEKTKTKRETKDLEITEAQIQLVEEDIRRRESVIEGTDNEDQ